MTMSPFRRSDSPTEDDDFLRELQRDRTGTSDRSDPEYRESRVVDDEPPRAPSSPDSSNEDVDPSIPESSGFAGQRFITTVSGVKLTVTSGEYSLWQKAGSPAILNKEHLERVLRAQLKANPPGGSRLRAAGRVIGKAAALEGRIQKSFVPGAARMRRPIPPPSEESLLIDLEEVDRISTLQDFDDPVADFLGIGVFEPAIGTSQEGGGASSGFFGDANVFDPKGEIVQELDVVVPGDLRVLGIIEDPRGKRGFMFLWKGETIPWYPPDKQDSVAGMFGI